MATQSNQAFLLSLAEEFIERGARAVTAENKIKGLTRPQAKSIYERVHGKPSPSGRLPDDVTPFLTNDALRNQGMMFWNNFQRTKTAKSTSDFAFVYAWITTYDHLLPFASTQRLDAERAALLAVRLEANEKHDAEKSTGIVVKTCRVCGTPTLADPLWREVYCTEHSPGKQRLVANA